MSSWQKWRETTEADEGRETNQKAVALTQARDIWDPEYLIRIEFTKSMWTGATIWNGPPNKMWLCFHRRAVWDHLHFADGKLRPREGMKKGTEDVSSRAWTHLLIFGVWYPFLPSWQPLRDATTQALTTTSPNIPSCGLQPFLSIPFPSPLLAQGILEYLPVHGQDPAT